MILKWDIVCIPSVTKSFRVKSFACSWYTYFIVFQPDKYKFWQSWSSRLTRLSWPGEVEGKPGKQSSEFTRRYNVLYLWSNCLFLTLYYIDLTLLTLCLTRRITVGEHYSYIARLTVYIVSNFRYCNIKPTVLSVIAITMSIPVWDFSAWTPVFSKFVSSFRQATMIM